MGRLGLCDAFRHSHSLVHTQEKAWAEPPCSTSPVTHKPWVLRREPPMPAPSWFLSYCVLLPRAGGLGEPRFIRKQRSNRQVRESLGNPHESTPCYLGPHCLTCWPGAPLGQGPGLPHLVLGTQQEPGD